MTEAPPAPPGPGVVPLFPAPPIEGRGRRVGMGLGIAGAVLVFVCGGGIAATIGLVTFGSRASDEEARVVIGHYLDAVKAKRYGAAYDQQCQQEKDKQTRAQFAKLVATQPPIASYRVGSVDVTSLTVPVTVTHVDGSTGTLSVTLGQDAKTGEVQVCGVEE